MTQLSRAVDLSKWETETPELGVTSLLSHRPICSLAASVVSKAPFMSN